MAVHGDAGDDQHGLKVHSVLDLDLDKQNPVLMDTTGNKHQTAPMDLDLDTAQAEPSASGQATGAATASIGEDCPQPVSGGGSWLPQPGPKAATSSDATQPAIGLAATNNLAAQPSSSSAGQQTGAAAARFAAMAAAKRSSMIAAAATASDPPGGAAQGTEVVDLTEAASPKSYSAGQGKDAGVLLQGEAATAAAELRLGEAATAAAELASGEAATAADTLLSPAAAAVDGVLLPHAAAAAAGSAAGGPAANSAAAKPSASQLSMLQHIQASACDQEPMHIDSSRCAASQQEGSLAAVDGRSDDEAASPPLSPDATQLYDSHCPVEVGRLCPFSLGVKLQCNISGWQQGMPLFGQLPLGQVLAEAAAVIDINVLAPLATL